MNGLDYVTIAVLSVGAIYGLRRGALRMVTSVVSLAAAIYVASLYYAKAGAIAQTQFSVQESVGAVIGYIAVFALIFAAVEIIGTGAIRLIHVVHMSSLDRLVGALLGGGVAASLMGLAMMLMAAVMPPDAEILRNSRMVPMLLAYNEAIIDFIPGEMRVAYQRNRDDLMKSWVLNAMKGASPAPSPAASPTPSAK